MSDKRHVFTFAFNTTFVMDYDKSREDLLTVQPGNSIEIIYVAENDSIKIVDTTNNVEIGYAKPDEINMLLRQYGKKVGYYGEITNIVFDIENHNLQLVTSILGLEYPSSNSDYERRTNDCAQNTDAKEEQKTQRNKFSVWFESLSSKTRYAVLFSLLAIHVLYLIFIGMNTFGAFLAFVTAACLFYTIYVEEKIARRKEYEKKLEEERLKEAAERRKKDLANSFSFNASISSGGTRWRNLEFPIYTKARGVTFEGRQGYLADSSVADDLIIEHRPTKKYPERMVIINESIDEQIGNVSAELAKALVEEYGEGCKFYGMIEDITGGQDGLYLGCNFSIDGVEYD